MRLNIVTKERTCPECGDRFMPFQSFQQCCLRVDCAISHSAKKRAKKEAKEYKSETTRLRRQHRDANRAFRTKAAQTACNAYIRKRDESLSCVSCGTTKDVQYAAGHFKSRGAHPELALNEYNLAKQCNQYCNLHRSGAVDDFRAELINRLGLSHVEWIEGYHEPQKLSIDELKDIEVYFKEKLKELQRDFN